MNTARFSAIAHTGLAYANPLLPAAFERLLDRIDLQPGARAIELGCGRAELLLRLIERFGIIATGVDRSAPFLDEARQESRRRVAPGALDLIEADASGWPLGDAAWDVAICIGSGPLASLAALAAAVRPRGWVIAGDAHWNGEPSPELLRALGATRGDLPASGSDEAAARAAGLEPQLFCSASTSDWDAYESAWLGNVERWAAANPDDPDAPAFLARARAGNDRHRRFGPLGFTVGLYRKR